MTITPTPQDQALVFAAEFRALYEAERERAARFRTLLDAGIATASLSDVNYLLTVTLQRLMEFSGHDGGAALLYVPDRRSLRVAASAGVNAPPVGSIGTELWQTVAGLVFRRNRPLHVSREQEEDDPDIASIPEWASVIVVPLKSSTSGRLGILYLTASTGPARLTKEDLQTVDIIGRQVSIAVENARLYTDLQTKKADLQNLVARLIQVQEDERRRVAYDLHDSLVQILVASHQSFETAMALAPKNPAEAEKWLDRGRDLVTRSVREARKIISGLRPSVLDDYGLVAALRAHVDNIATSAELRVEMEDCLGRTRMSPATEVALYRIAQEALNNVRKHAHTQRARVSIARQGDKVLLEVQDWGKGFAPKKARRRKGVGLADMEERAALIGGKVTVTSSSKRGTRIKVEVPLKHK